MTKLPEKELLSGTKTPHTTTGEMKEALGKVRDYLNELLGEDSLDKEAARQALGIDLEDLAEKIEAKADRQTTQEALQNKADKSYLETEIAKKGVHIGTIEYFAMTTPPAGYLKADGTAVGRETYPDLFVTIGTTFGEGDGQTTFNLPDLMGRFPEGSASPGEKFEAGLPNITGGIGLYNSNNTYGATRWNASNYPGSGNSVQASGSSAGYVEFAASFANSIYGASDTVQPPALTLLPCIKAFDAVTNPGLIDVAGLANDVNGKLDKVIDSKPVRCIVDTYEDGTNWWRQWSDGWVEQGGTVSSPSLLVNNDITKIVTLAKPMQDVNYGVSISRVQYFGYWPWVEPVVIRGMETLEINFFNTGAGTCGNGLWTWHIQGKGA